MGFIASSLRRNFLAGILVVVPFGLTIIILFKLGQWIAGLVGAVPANFLKRIDMPPYLGEAAAVAIGLVSTLLIVLIVGALARNFIGRKLLDIGESIISRIPFARTIYSATKQIIETLFLNGDFGGIKRVVMFEYPRKGIYSLGFVTGVVDITQSPVQGQRLVRVFLPTSPNPTSGYFLMVPEGDLKELPISTEEAFKIIMSLGLATEQRENFYLGEKRG